MSNEGKRKDIIKALITGLIDDAQSLRLDAAEMPRRVNWRAKVDINDTGKLIGKKAAHLYSLRVLISLMGARFGEDWRFEVSDPDDGERKEKAEIQRVKEIDASPVREFLFRILEGVIAERPEIHFVAQTNEYGWREYAFTILATKADYSRLTTPVMVGREKLAPVAALGTLFRAYGRQQGVSFTIQVPPL